MIAESQIGILNACIKSVLFRLDLTNLSGKRLFITGGTGFFGLWLLSALSELHESGVAVSVCVLSRDPERFLKKHAQFRGQKWLSFLCGNVRDFEFPQENYDYLIHAATETSMAAHSSPGVMFDDIVLGTRHVLNLAEKSRVDKILLISSGAVYGAQSPSVTHQPEDGVSALNPLLPASAYGEGKRVMELLGSIFADRTGIEVIVARCFAFCGPGLPIDAHFAIGNFVRDALLSDSIVVQGDGTAVRSYLHGADLAVWLLHLLLAGDSGQAYNVGSDESISIKDLAHLVQNKLAPDKEVRILGVQPERGLKLNYYTPNISKARSLGCEPWTDLSTALFQMADFFRKSIPD